VTKFLKFSIVAFAIASLWCALPRDSHSRETHACSCTCCANRSCQNCCSHTDDAIHTLESLTLAAGSIGSSSTCSCANRPLPSSENAVALIDQDIKKIKKVSWGAFYAASRPADYERCSTLAKPQSVHIPTVRQLYLLNASLLL
jgi:hypothetical protein